MDDDWPVAVPNMPTAQPRQLVDPEEVWYWPAAQFEQTLVLAPAAVPNWPIMQLTQAVALVVVWYWPATHTAHTEEPVAAAY